MTTSYDNFELAVHKVLRDWFNVMEDGSVQYRMPDPDYVRPSGKEPWTEAQLQVLVDVIDTYVWEQKSWAQGKHKVTYDADPGYERLTSAQRLAFAQDLERALNDPDAVLA